MEIFILKYYIYSASWFDKTRGICYKINRYCLMTVLKSLFQVALIVPHRGPASVAFTTYLGSAKSKGWGGGSEQ